MRTVFQYSFLLFTIFCLGLCSFASYQMGRNAIDDFMSYGGSYYIAQMLSNHLWIFPFITFFGVFALIFEIRSLIFETHRPSNEQLDEILIEKKLIFVIKKRYKMGFSLFCVGLLAFGAYIVPFQLLEGVSFHNEEFLLIALPSFFAISGFIYFFDMLKKQKEKKIKT